MDPILIITSLPDRSSALVLAEKLIDLRLSVCVNILATCTSIYYWQNKIETAKEIPLFIKTLSQHYTEVEQTIKAMHPYELPEIIAVPVTNCLPKYLQWMIDEIGISDRK